MTRHSVERETESTPCTRGAAPAANGYAGVADLTFPLVVAHRGGANLFPENTMAAYEGAAAMGCQAIEAGDLQLTSDGALVAMHDTTVDRTTDGSGNVAAYTAPGIRTLRVERQRGSGAAGPTSRCPRSPTSWTGSAATSSSCPRRRAWERRP